MTRDRIIQTIVAVLVGVSAWAVACLAFDAPAWAGFAVGWLTYMECGTRDALRPKPLAPVVQTFNETFSFTSPKLTDAEVAHLRNELERTGKP